MTRAPAPNPLGPVDPCHLWSYYCDYYQMPKKRTIPAGRFKAECLALLDRIAETGEPYVVTKHGRPVAEVIPVRAGKARPLAGSVTISGDIVGPILDRWDADR